jgi:hypothetical protein
MANSIKDGIINYSSVKYKIIGETDTYYIGFGIRSLRSVLCRINKDLTGWKSKSINVIIDLTKAVINSDGSIVAIGNKYTQEILDYDCPGSYRVYNESIICRYKSDLSTVDPETGLYPFIVCNKESHPAFNDIYFKDIIKFNDKYIIAGHVLTKNGEILGIVCDYYGLRDFYSSAMLNLLSLPGSSKRSPFQAKTVVESVLDNNDSVMVVSRLENVTHDGNSYLHGIKLSIVHPGSLATNLCQVLFGAKFMSMCYANDHLFILGAYQTTTKTNGGTITVHGKLQYKVYKVDRVNLSVETLILDGMYDKITLDGDKLVLEVEYDDPETAGKLILDKRTFLLAGVL